MTRITGFVVAGLAAVSVVASAASAAPVAEQRVRGTIEGVSGNTMTVKSDAGQAIQMVLGSKTQYVSIVPSSLASLKKGEFIGTATKGPKDFMVALEVVIFPASMRGMGEGSYTWDKLADTTMKGGTTVSSTMTNGTVAAAAPANSEQKVASTMTNGNVTSGATTSAGKQITVSYGKGTATILVPPTVPIVRFQPATRAIVVAGQKAFVIAGGAGGTLDAGFVAVGKNGLTPPM